MKEAALLLITTLALFAQVDYERLANAAKEPGNWLTYSGAYNGHRYSRLAQIAWHDGRQQVAIAAGHSLFVFGLLE